MTRIGDLTSDGECRRAKVGRQLHCHPCPPTLRLPHWRPTEHPPYRAFLVAVTMSGAPPVSKTYQCPLCRRPLTKAKYEAVLKIQEARDRTTRAEIERAHAVVHRERAARQAAVQKLRESRAREKQARAEGVKQGRT